MSAYTLYCQKLQSLATSLSLIVWVYLHSNFRGKAGVFWNRMHNDPSRSSKIVDFGTNRKRVCDFLLVINSNLCPILPRSKDIAGFLLRRATPPLFGPNFRSVPLGLHCRYRHVARGSEDPRIIIGVITFKLTLHICPRYINVTDRQTDRQLRIAIPR